jgi:hypothetical protein
LEGNGELFTEEEKVILTLVKETTLIHQHGVSDFVCRKPIQLFG